MIEVEQKYWLDDEPALLSRLRSMDAVEGPTQRHVDQYFNHPVRDFRETKEALRIRRINGIAYVTYKGAKLPGDVKARKELEWCLSPGDVDGSLTRQLWLTLGFRWVADVHKLRRLFTCPSLGEQVSITVDTVDGVGSFSEIEWVVQDESGVEAARMQILEVASRLHLRRAEPMSYLNLLLRARSGPQT